MHWLTIQSCVSNYAHCLSTSYTICTCYYGVIFSFRWPASSSVCNLGICSTRYRGVIRSTGIICGCGIISSKSRCRRKVLCCFDSFFVVVVIRWLPVMSWLRTRITALYVGKKWIRRGSCRVRIFSISNL